MSVCLRYSPIDGVCFNNTHCFFPRSTDQLFSFIPTICLVFQRFNFTECFIEFQHTYVRRCCGNFIIEHREVAIATYYKYRITLTKLIKLVPTCTIEAETEISNINILLIQVFLKAGILYLVLNSLANLPNLPTMWK